LIVRLCFLIDSDGSAAVWSFGLILDAMISALRSHNSDSDSATRGDTAIQRLKRFIIYGHSNASSEMEAVIKLRPILLEISRCVPTDIGGLDNQTEAAGILLRSNLCIESGRADRAQSEHAKDQVIQVCMFCYHITHIIWFSLTDYSFYHFGHSL
jgi:hypothetical protein